MSATPALIGPGYARMARVSGADYLIRPAEQADLDAIAAFEVEIALVSFGEDAIADPAFHRRRVAAALGRPGDTALVAVAAGSRRGAGHGRPVGWAWLTARTNSLTGARYGNFRSLAVAAGPDRPRIGELLMNAILRAAEEQGFTMLSGKVHAANIGMRALYRRSGFTATHITMEKHARGGTLAADSEPGPEGRA